MEIRRRYEKSLGEINGVNGGLGNCEGFMLMCVEIIL